MTHQNSFTQTSPLNIIPIPWKAEVRPGLFVLTPETDLILDDHLIEIAPVAAALAEYLGRAGTFDLQTPAEIAFRLRLFAAALSPR